MFVVITSKQHVGPILRLWGSSAFSRLKSLTYDVRKTSKNYQRTKRNPSILSKAPDWKKPCLGALKHRRRESGVKQIFQCGCYFGRVSRCRSAALLLSGTLQVLLCCSAAERRSGVAALRKFIYISFHLGVVLLLCCWAAWRCFASLFERWPKPCGNLWNWHMLLQHLSRDLRGAGFSFRGTHVKCFAFAALSRRVFLLRFLFLLSLTLCFTARLCVSCLK